MHGNDDDTEDGPSLVSRRTVEVALSLFLLAIALIAIYDSVRIGFTWREDGPAPGFFPFWVGVMLAVSSIMNMLKGMRQEYGAETFVTKPQFGRVLAVLIPATIYVALIEPLGIYLASAIFIALFMIFMGKENPLKAVLVGAAVPLAAFMLFEKWFLVPLPKGPIEAALGLG